MTQKCDQATQLCGGDTCLDKRLDAFEIDIDCGGFYCRAHIPGERCNANFDCRAGTHCDATQQPPRCKSY